MIFAIKNSLFDYLKKLLRKVLRNFLLIFRHFDAGLCFHNPLFWCFADKFFEISYKCRVIVESDFSCHFGNVFVLAF